MKFIRNRSLTTPAFLMMPYSQVTMYSFAFCLYLTTLKKEKKKQNKTKTKTKLTDSCIDSESNRELLVHQPCILPPD